MFAEPNLENLCAFLSIAVKVVVRLAASTARFFLNQSPDQ
jgi:hypothetical protein